MVSLKNLILLRFINLKLNFYEKHQYDGAMYTTIEIVWDDKKYKSAGFDDDNPPKELIPFFHY